MGTGKTYCASRVIDWLRAGLSSNKNDEAFAYFYCNKQDAARSEAKSILRNIIRQLATGPWKPEGLASSTTVHKTVHDLWKEGKGAGISSTWVQWETCLSALIETYPRTTIVLDAVDECEEGQRNDLLTLLTVLSSRSTQTSQVKIFVTTRPEQGILQHLDGHLAIRTQESHSTRDIENFVRTKLEKHSRCSRWPRSFHEEIVDTLLQKGGDMFLFAALQLEDLLKCRTEPAIRTRLQTVPKSLNEKYEDICQRATPEPEDRKVLDRALRWVLCSATPLTTDELLFAISQDSDLDHINSGRHDLDENLILEWGHNLLCLENTGSYSPPVWRLAHQAVAEFLENSTCCKSILAHCEAGKVCLMILLDVFGGQPTETLSDSHDIPEEGQGFECSCGSRISLSLEDGGNCGGNHRRLQDPLTEYAIQAWPTHVRALDGEACGVGALSQTLQRFLGQPRGSPIYKRWLIQCTFTGRPKFWSIFHARPLPPTRKKSTCMTPMSLACHLGIYNTLLEWWNSFDLNPNMCISLKDWMPGHFYLELESIAWSLLALACLWNESKIYTHLLERGARSTLKRKIRSHQSLQQQWEMQPKQ